MIASDQHSVARSIVLHLLPGAVLAVLLFIMAPLGEGLGLPSLFTFLVLGLLILIPVELGWLLYEKKRLGDSLCLKLVVPFQRRTPVWQSSLLVLGLVAWSMLVAAIINPPVETFLTERIFFWWPQVYRLDSFLSHTERYSRSILVTSAVLMVLVNGLVGPVVEELYFRGYLLPRMARSGSWAPLASGVLFSLYHFFSPWQNPLRIIALTPLFYAVWWRQDVRLGIWVHCLVNLVGSTMLLVQVLRSLP